MSQMNIDIVARNIRSKAVWIGLDIAMLKIAGDHGISHLLLHRINKFQGLICNFGIFKIGVRSILN